MMTREEKIEELHQIHASGRAALINKVMACMVFLFGLTILLMGYLLFYPFDPVVLNVSPFKVEKKVYKQGDYIRYTLDFTKKTQVAPRIKYFLVDGVVYPLTKQSGVSRPVGYNKPGLLLKIPEGVPPGKYLLQIDLEYPVNAFRTIYRSWQSTMFEVVE